MIRILSYNIREGGVGREQSIAAVIRACDPDVVVLQEAVRPDVVKALGRACGLPTSGAAPRSSLGFMSRVPIATFQWHHPYVSRRAFLELALRDVPLRIFGVHLSAVHAAWTERRRTFELGALLRSIRAHQDGPHVLVGDFNTLAPGELLDPRKLPARLRALVWMSGGRVRWRTIALVQEAGYVDAFRALNPDEPGLTFPAASPHVRLDYLFVPSHMRSAVRSCEVVRAPDVSRASDHCPLLTTIDIGASH